MAVSPLWLQAMLLTFVVGFAIPGYLALRVHVEHAPVPGRVVDESGRLLITGEAIMQGQEAFLTHGLMQFGSVYGHGAYLGPDFTTDYLQFGSVYGHGHESGPGRVPRSRFYFGRMLEPAQVNVSVSSGTNHVQESIDVIRFAATLSRPARRYSVDGLPPAHGSNRPAAQ
jgi:nitric oxide reductase large subunit